MRSFKTFLAEQQLPKLPKDPIARDVQARFQGMRQNVISGKPLYPQRGTGRSSSVPTPGGRGMSPAAAEVRRRQLDRGEGLASGEAISTIGPELIVPGGVLTAPTRAAMLTIPRALKFGRDQPYKFLNRKLGINRLRQKMPGATKLILPGTRTASFGSVYGAGGAISAKDLTKNVNEYLAQQGIEQQDRLSVPEVLGVSARALSEPESARDLPTPTQRSRARIGKFFTNLGKVLTTKQGIERASGPAGISGVAGTYNPLLPAASEFLFKEPSLKARINVSRSIPKGLESIGMKPAEVYSKEPTLSDIEATQDFENLRRAWLSSAQKKAAEREDKSTSSGTQAPSTGIDYSQLL